MTHPHTNRTYTDAPVGRQEFTTWCNAQNFEYRLNHLTFEFDRCDENGVFYRPRPLTDKEIGTEVERIN